MSVISTGSSNGLFVKDLDDVLGIGAQINSAGAFVASQGPIIRRVTGNPNGFVSDRGGSLALDVANGTFYINTTTGNALGTSWSVVSRTVAAPSVATGDGFPVSNSVAEGGSYDYTIQANTLRVGSTITLQWQARVTNAGGAGTNLTTRIHLGSGVPPVNPTIFSSGPTDPTAPGWFIGGTTYLVVRSIGAGGTCIGYNDVAGLNTGVVPVSRTIIGSTAINTTVANSLTLTFQWSAADASSVVGEIYSVTVS